MLGRKGGFISSYDARQHATDHESARSTRATWTLRAVMKAVAVVSLAVLATLGLIWISQRRLIYFPTQDVPDPATFLLDIEEVTYATEDGLSLVAWYVPAAGGESRGTVVVFNGNAGNRAHRVPLAEALAGRGFAVLLVDYRGYGGNPGRPSEVGLASDARAAVAYLKTRPDVDPGRIAYFGESLGAGVALGLARHQPPTALVLRSPFTSLRDIGATHYPFLPTSLMLWDRYPNLETVSEIDSPTLIIAGSADSIVPLGQSETLFEAAPGPKHFALIEGADHNDFALIAGDRLVNEVVAFLDDVLSAGNG